MTVEKKPRYTESQKNASLKYAKQKLKRVPLDIRIAKYEEIKETAESVNESVNGFIKKAIDNRIEAIRSGQERAED